jgi:UDP-N-acetylmuramyl pentapeptide phosphotransferase/UDP-N-acetylglucosamine-1-phosphate transferase
MEYLLIGCLLFFTELLYFYFASKFNITDSPNHRSSHSRATIRGGGIIFTLAIILFRIWNPLPASFLIGFFLIGVISFLDDIFSLPNKLRITFHLISVSFLFLSLDIFASWPIPLVLIAYILVIGAINAYNFMDGINGIFALYTLSILITLYWLNSQYAFTNDGLIFVLGLGTLIFAFFNCRRKAICFAGDVGSVSIAFILIYLVISLIIFTGNPVFIILFSVYGVDSVMTIFNRILRKENIFKAHRSHLYQLMANEHHMQHLTVSSLYFAVQMSVNVILIAILPLSVSFQCLVGLGVLIVLTSIYWVVRWQLNSAIATSR